MKLALGLGYWQAKPLAHFVELAQAAERCGFDMVTTSEAYGSDVFTPLAYIAARTERIKLGTAIMQISARSPTCAATTAMTLDHLSNGRLVLGVGVSGPQVVEGWYGQPFERPLERTREWLEIFRQVVARERPVVFQGRQYRLPYDGPGATGLGKPLMSITHPLRPRIPVYLGAEGPKNVALAVERFDGWFAFLTPPERFDIWAETLRSAPPGFEIVCPVSMALVDDPRPAMLEVKQMLALYIGGMGAKEQNFHKRVVERYGYAEVATRIQELWLGGRQREAVAAVPDELVDVLALIGSADHIRARLAAWRRSPVTTLLVNPAPSLAQSVQQMEFLARELL
ncbi:MAG: LLM class F420-dependent oxidoreductase [Steroidobacteraceae bacterium]|nr:LLM class F420-dependent oxidoreductase [Steroidobacteraceae bacterium]MDW8258585.1 LLM class F420-dependent oxidoreductase [Gammaproteobacteria bacterium]